VARPAVGPQADGGSRRLSARTRCPRPACRPSGPAGYASGGPQATNAAAAAGRRSGTAQPPKAAQVQRSERLDTAQLAYARHVWDRKRLGASRLRRAFPVREPERLPSSIKAEPIQAVAPLGGAGWGAVLLSQQLSGDAPAPRPRVLQERGGSTRPRLQTVTPAWLRVMAVNSTSRARCCGLPLNLP
jgi:hypothetical protein